MSPRRIVAPPDQAALVETLRRALLEDGSKCLALGSQTSKSPCFKTKGLGVLLSAFDRVERVGPNTVRLGSGVILSDLLSFLRTEGLALPTIGEWSGQTMGGAISTGTHGGSYTYGSLCASVMAVTYMNALGEVVTVRRGEQNFEHLLPSFGTTGVALEYELDCVPHFDVCVTRRCLPFDRYLHELLENPEKAVFRSSIWLPSFGCVIDYVADPIDSLPEDYVTDREVRYNDTAIVLDWLAKRSPGPRRAKRRLRRFSAVQRSLAAGPRALFPQRYYRGSYDDMLAPLRGSAENILKKRKKNSTPPEGEFALSQSQAAALLTSLNEYFWNTGHYPDRPIGLRPGAEETGSLAATQGGPSTWISMFIDSTNPLMNDLPDLLVEFGARPHWGKCVFHRPADVRALYPKWSAFQRFRRTQDPNGRFINEFATRLGFDET